MDRLTVGRPARAGDGNAASRAPTSSCLDLFHCCPVQTSGRSAPMVWDKASGVGVLLRLLPHVVMAGLVPAIHVPPPPRPLPACTAMPQDVDARNKSGHDGGRGAGGRGSGSRNPRSFGKATQRLAGWCRLRSHHRGRFQPEPPPCSRFVLTKRYPARFPSIFCTRNAGPDLTEPRRSVSARTSSHLAEEVKGLCAHSLRATAASTALMAHRAEEF